MGKMKICLDAGHYAKGNPYVINGEVINYESRMAWSLHKHLGAALKQYGAEVSYTRPDREKDLELTARGQCAKGCGLFLSLHSNAGGGDTTDYPLSCTNVDGGTDELGLALADAVGEAMGCAQPPRIWKRDYYSGGGAMIQTTAAKEYGKPTADLDWYGVLRGAKAVGVPGVLLECSFHTNPHMAGWLSAEENLKALAKGLAAVIAKHYKLKGETVDWKAQYEALETRYNCLAERITQLSEEFTVGGVL